MSIYYKWRRWRGFDVIDTVTGEYDRYEYTITHLNGEVTVCEGNSHRRDNGFLLIMEPDGETWAMWSFEPGHELITPGFGWRGWETVRELEGIQEVEREKIGTDVYEVDYDRAENKIVKTVKRFEPC